MITEFIGKIGKRYSAPLLVVISDDVKTDYEYLVLMAHKHCLNTPDWPLYIVIDAVDSTEFTCRHLSTSFIKDIAYAGVSIKDTSICSYKVYRYKLDLENSLKSLSDTYLKEYNDEEDPVYDDTYDISTIADKFVSELVPRRTQQCVTFRTQILPSVLKRLEGSIDEEHFIINEFISAFRTELMKLSKEELLKIFSVFKKNSGTHITYEGKFYFLKRE